MNTKTFYLSILFFLTRTVIAFEYTDILTKLRNTHDPLVAHDLIMDTSKNTKKISNTELCSLFVKAQAQHNNSAMMHISNSYHICKSDNSKIVCCHPIGSVAHLTLANIITMLAEVSPFRLQKHAYDQADAPYEYISLRKQALTIIKSAIQEKNIFAFLVQILMKNATITGIDNTQKLFEQATHLLVSSRQKKNVLISDELLSTLLSFSTTKTIDQKNAESLYSFILLRSCLQNNNLSFASSFYPATIIGYLQKYTQFEELHYWLGALLFNSTENDVVRIEAFRQLIKSKFVPIQIDSNKEFKIPKSLSLYLESVTNRPYNFNENIQLLEPALLFTAKKLTDWEFFQQYIATHVKLYTMDFYQTFLTTNGEQASRFSEDIKLKTVARHDALPILMISRGKELLATLTPEEFGENCFQLSKIVAEESPSAHDQIIINYLEAWYAHNPTKHFEKKEIWHYLRIFKKSKQFFDFLDNKHSVHLPRLSRQLSDPLPLIHAQKKLQAKELTVKKFTVSFHEEILSSSDDDKPKDENK